MKRFLRITFGIICFLFFVFVTAFFTFPLPGKIPVLMYHMVGSHEDAKASNNFVDREKFAEQMALLKLFGYHVVSIDEFYAIKTNQQKPRGREIAITFDDGNVSVATEVVPILKKYEYPIMLFLITETLKSGGEGSMSVGTVQELVKNKWISIGSHTRTHPILSEVTENQQRAEIIDSKAELQEMFHRPIHFFAYPLGDFNPQIEKIVEEAGYKLAFTTSPKKLKMSPVGPMAMTRLKISKVDDNPIVFWSKISGLYEAYKLWAHRRHQSLARS